MGEPGRTVLFGGSFNPFHKGHEAMMRAALAHRPGAELLLIPAGSPPHKSGRPLLPFADRRAVLEELAAGDARVSVSDIESRRQGPTYTIETVAALRAERPGPYDFLIGGDSLRDLPKWYRFRELIDQVQILTAARPGVELEDSLAALAEHISPEALAGIRAHILDMDPHEHSSTAIRERLQRGQSIAGLVPEPVLAYLERHRLLDDLAACA